MEYKRQDRVPHICFVNGDFRESLEMVSDLKNVIVVTDPPFNIGYHYGTYKDDLPHLEYCEMLCDLVRDYPSVIIHYPEFLHELSALTGCVPNRVCSWVYNSNTARQHRDIAFYRVEPSFKNAFQPYKNQNDKRIKALIASGRRGGRMYDWWNVNQVKNTSKEKTKHPCQMPLEIMKNIVSTLPYGSVVFDPFMGSGTTALACIELGYDFVGCEIDPEYYEIAKERCGAN